MTTQLGNDSGRPAIGSARTLLFVPGDRPDRFPKAAASPADGIVLDLEDGVAPRAKSGAREHVRAWREAGRPGLVRINAVDSPWWADDVAALGSAPVTVMLPKTHVAADVQKVLLSLPFGSSVVAIIESAAGVFEARAIGAVPGVVRLAFGNGDLAAELGVDHGDCDALAYSRSQVVLASAACGLAPPLDGVTTALDDEDAIRADTRHAARLGFTGKLCIHPRQVDVVHRALAPSPEDLEWAVRTMNACHDGGAVAANGHLIDKPIVERARRLLVRAGIEGIAALGEGLGLPLTRDF